MSIKDSFDKIVMPEDMKNGLRTRVEEAAEAATRKLHRRRILNRALPAAAALALIAGAAGMGSSRRRPIRPSQKPPSLLLPWSRLQKRRPPRIKRSALSSP